jgi:hypothetical protein
MPEAEPSGEKRHNFAVWSAEPVAKRDADGWNATERTPLMCSFIVATQVADDPLGEMRHNLAMWSKEPVAKRGADGWNATDKTLLLCPSSVATHSRSGSIKNLDKITRTSLFGFLILSSPSFKNRAVRILVKLARTSKSCLCHGSKCIFGLYAKLVDSSVFHGANSLEKYAIFMAIVLMNRGLAVNSASQLLRRANASCLSGDEL